MNKRYVIWIGWLVLVIAWNFGFPSVPPLADVIVAVGLSFLSMGITHWWR